MAKKRRKTRSAAQAGQTKTLPPRRHRAAQTSSAPSPTDSGPSALVEAQELPRLPEFPVVGIGASAGGLEACTQLLQALPPDLGAPVILVQHLSPSHDSVLAELLGSSCRMPVITVDDAMPIQPNHVYVVPPNSQMGILDGKLHLIRRPHDASQYKPVDFFFRALAGWAQTQAIGVVLSGTDSDGTAGLREIKGAGGTTIAQDPKTAKYDGMPRSAINSGMVDLVLPPREIAHELQRIARHPLLAPQPAAPAMSEAMQDEDAFHRLFKLLRNATGVDFTQYKQPTIRRRLGRRLVLHKLSNLEQYLRFLEQTPGEISALQQDILIHVTRFFRDAGTFELLAQRVFPQITVDRDAETPVRIWVPGCSTGEEAYSIAIALLEFLGERAGSVPIQVFATDVSEKAIGNARDGVFPDSIAIDVSPERLARFFTRGASGYRINKQVRELCVFARQDLTRDPPFSRLDLIACRNVLIYLGPALQRKLMNVFHYALKPGAFLMLGSAETIGAHSELFATAEQRHRLYVKRESGAQPEVDFKQYAPRPAQPGAKRPQGDQDLPTINLQKEAVRLLLNRYAPPGVVVDDDLQIIQFRGQVGAFLEPAPGEASLNLLKMAREGLLYGLRTALHKVRQSNEPVRKERLRVTHDGQVREVNLEVIPLVAPGQPRHFLVTFQDITQPAQPKTPRPARKAAGAASRGGGGRQRQAARLQEELAASREYLQTIIQDLEAANEELQAANEEILSSNEELQSTNEELDTAREELQSTNEEIHTVNDELQGRNEELGRLNSDLVNLLGSVQIAIVMVSGDLRIRRFTPMAEKALNLIPTDVGRPISDIHPNIDCPELEELIHEAMDSVSAQEREVQDRQGKWYALRIRPYKNLENRIDGAVLALFDIDAVREKEQEAREARQFAEDIVQTLRAPLLVLDGKLRVKQANRAFYDAFHVTPTGTEAVSLFELGNGQWNIPRVRSLLDDVLRGASRIDDVRVEHEFPDVGRRVMLLNARVLQARDGAADQILLAIEDATDRQKAQDVNGE